MYACARVCVWEGERETDRVNVLPKVMSWGLLLTPTPALVPAATSTRYCTPVCRPPTTTERMVASTDLLTWKRVSLARHQIWQRRDTRIHSTGARCIIRIYWVHSAIKVFDPTLYSWMMPFCWSEGGGSHDTLMEVVLWLPIVNTVTCCGGAPGAARRKNKKKQRKKRENINVRYVKWGSRLLFFFKEKCVFDHVKGGFVFRSPTLYIHAANTKTI